MMQNVSGYNGGLTREQFLFYEMRTTARLLVAGLPDEEAINQIVEENLFQYPTERTLPNLSRVCVKRLRAMGSEDLLATVANDSFDVAKQVCLYAIMKQNRLVWDFMVSVIGEKYRTQDLTFSKMDLNVFFMQLQEQSDVIAGWSDSTIKKIGQVITRFLVETGYLDSTKATRLNPVWLYPVLENVIRENGEEILLPAFNCFE